MDSALYYIPLTTTLLPLLLTFHKSTLNNTPTPIPSPHLPTTITIPLIIPTNPNPNPKQHKPHLLHTHLLPPILHITLYLTTLLSTFHLTNEPQRILSRGSPTFVAVTDPKPGDEERWDEFWTRWHKNVPDLWAAEIPLFRCARVQRFCLFAVVFLLVVGFVGEVWGGWRRWVDRGGGVGGLDERDEKVDGRLKKGGLYKRQGLAVLTLVLVIVVGLCPLQKVEQRFTSTLRFLVGEKGSWPEIAIEWSRCYGGRRGPDIWFCDRKMEIGGDW